MPLPVGTETTFRMARPLNKPKLKTRPELQVRALLPNPKPIKPAETKRSLRGNETRPREPSAKEWIKLTKK